MEDKKALKDKELESVSGGSGIESANVVGNQDLPERDERQGWISSAPTEEHCPTGDGKDMGSWRTISGE